MNQQPAPQGSPSGFPDLVLTVDGLSWVLPPVGPYVVGRGTEADVQLSYPEVSRKHFTLSADDVGWFIRDLGSTNGLHIDGSPQSAYRIVKPTVVNLGEGAPLVELHLQEAAVPPPPPVPDATVFAAPSSAPEVFQQPPPQVAVPAPTLSGPPVPASPVSGPPVAPPSGFGLPTPPPPHQAPNLPVGPGARPAGAGEANPLFQDTTLLFGSDGAEKATRTLTSGAAQRYVAGTFNSNVQSEATIGRGEDAAITVTDPLVSRSHASIQNTSSGVVLTDLKSSNGTFVNGRRIREVWLEEGDVVTVGNTDLVYTNGVLEAVVRGKSSKPALVASEVVLDLPNGKRLLDEVSVALGEGSLTAIVGPSGAGKSTFAKVVAGLASATSGGVYLDGFDVHANYESLRSRIGFVPQDDVVHGKLTVDQALRSAAKLRLPGATTADREATIDRVTDELGLTEHRKTRVDRLSGGQRKRVSTAIELLTGPQLLLLDEPTSGLDPALDLTVMQMLRRLADAGRVVVVVTHSVAQLEETCDNLLFLAPGGKTAYWGTTKGLREAYGEQDWAEIFADVARNPALAHARYLDRQRTKEPPALPEPKTMAPPTRASKHHWSQWKTLIGRQLTLTVADPGLLVFLIGLPLILGALALIVPGEAGFGVANPDSPAEANHLLVLLILGAAFMGAALSIRDLVGERSIYHRERAAGLSPLAYVVSKFLVLGAFTAIQSVELTLVVGIWKDVSGEGSVLPSQWLELGLVVWGTAWASAMLGLLASSLVKTGEQTMPVLVVIVMVQLVMTGGMIPVSGRSGLEQVSWLVPARWGFAAGASTVDLQAMVVGAQEDSLWDHTAGQWWMNMGILLAMIAITTVLTWWNVRLKKGRRKL